jgi:DNA-binding NarL/FixJ family response regulator
MRPRLIIADDHALIVEGLKRILEPEFQVVGWAADGRELLHLVATTQPDAVLLDISMPLLNGLETLRRIKAQSPRLPVVVLTMHSESDYVREAFRAGASAFVLKSSVAAELLTAVREVLAHRTYITSLLQGLSLEVLEHEAGKPGRSDPLTSRQREVLQLVAEGRTGKEIAAILHISVKTVEFHKSCIMRELDLHTTADLTRYALNHGIIPPGRI